MLNRWAFAAARSMTATRLRQSVEVLVAQVSRHDRDRDRIITGGLSQAGDQRAGAVLAGSCSQHEDRNVFILINHLENFLRRLAIPDHALWRDACDAVGAACELIELLVRGFVCLRLHDVGNAEPLLM